MVLTRIINCCLVLVLVTGVVACSKPSSDGFFYGAFDNKPKLIISSSSVIATAPYHVAQYSTDGVFEKVLYDSTFQNVVPRSMVAIDPFSFLIATETVDSILRFSLFDGPSTFVSDSNFTGNIFEMARTDNGDIFVIEGNFVESFNSAGVRIGNPRIGTTVGSCTLAVARGMAVTASGLLVVGSQTNDDIQFYDVSNPAATTCSASNQTLGNVDPVAIVAHSDGYVYVAHSGGTDAILRFNGDGSGSSTSIFSNLTVINNPTAMMELPDGTLLVASDGTNNIVRIDTSGNVLNNPFIQNGFTSFVQSMIVLETP